jgi:hypothetical protein
MSNWLREYGGAIGPGLAFLLGLITLFVKDRIEHRLRRTRASHLFEQFKKFALAHDPPEWIPVPTEDGHPKGDANRRNHLRFKDYYFRLLAARSFMDANEKTIAESATLAMLQEFYEFKWRFVQLVDYVKSCTEAERPLNEGDLMQVQGFHVALKNAAD